jgi:ABC-type uncharacterized transport system substrate-binding protein
MIYNPLTSHGMSEKCHGHADTFSQNKHNIYGYTDSKGLKITCQNIQHVLPKLDEIKYNIGNMNSKPRRLVFTINQTKP